MKVGERGLMRFLKGFVLIILLCFIFGTNVCWAEEKKTDPRTDPKTAWVYKWKFSGKTTYGDKPAERKNDPGVVSYDASGGGETLTVRHPTSLLIEGYTYVSDPNLSKKERKKWQKIPAFHPSSIIHLGKGQGPNIVTAWGDEDYIQGKDGYWYSTWGWNDDWVKMDGELCQKRRFECTLINYKGDNNGCWACDFYNTLFNICNELASRLYPALKTMCIYFLGLWFAIYILVKMVKYYLTLGAIDPRKFFPEIFKPFISMIIAIILILNIKQVYTDFIDPLAELSIAFSNEISEAGNLDYSNHHSSIETGTYSVSCVPGKTIKTDVGLGEGVNNAIQCFMQKISASVLSQMAIGSTLMYGAWHPGRMSGDVTIFPRFHMLFTGILVYITTALVFFSCSFKMVDGMIRLIFVTSLLPLWIVCWVLPASKKYAAKAFEMFLHVLLNFLFLSVIMIIILYLLDASLLGTGDKSKFIKLLKDANKIEEASQLINSTSFLFKYVMYTLISFTLLGKVDSFVSHFVSGGKLGIGDGLGKMAVDLTLQKPAQKIVKPIVNKVVDKTGKKVASKVKGFFKKKDPPPPPPSKTPFASITENAGKENEITRVFETEEEYKKYQEQERQRFERERREQDERLRKEKEQRERERREEEERRRKKDEEEEKKRQEEEKKVSDALNKLNERLAEIEKERSARELQARMEDMERQHDEIWKGWKGPIGPTTPDGSPASTQQPEDKGTPTANPSETTQPKPEAEDKTSGDSGAPDDGAGKK